MERAFDGALSPNPHYYQIKGRAAEIARALGSRVGGAEHLFLGMLHDGGWPVNVIARLVDLGQAEAAVLGILNSPGYSPPPVPRILVPAGYVRAWGAEIAFEMGDSYLGVEHAFLAMIRMRETVPARALASLADLDELEAAVLEAKNAPAGGPPEDAVFLPEGQEMDGPLRRAVADALPDSTTFSFSDDDNRTWIRVIGPPVQGGRERSLPVFLTYPRHRRPAHRHAPARFEPAEDPASDQIAVEPVERVTDDGQFEVPGLRVKGLGVRHDRPDIRRTLGGGLGPDYLYHVRFLVHGPHLGKPTAQREG